MEEALKYVDNTEIENIDNIGDSLMLLIDSFPEVKADYMRDGLGYLIARMLTCENSANIVKGLEIVGWVSECGSK